MSEIYGIGSHGFNIPPMPTIKADLVKAYQDKFGVDINTLDSSHFGQQIDLQAYNEYRVWQQMLMTYNSQTPTGAEGVFLDELFAKQNIWRKGKQAGGGEVAIETDKNCPYQETVSKSVEYDGSNGVKYSASADTVLGANVIAYRLRKQDLEVKTYTFEKINPIDGSKQSQSIQLASLHTINIQAFLRSVKDFFKTTVGVDESLLQIDELNQVFYAGYTHNYNLTGIENSIGLNVTPTMIGNRVSQVTVVAQDKGYHPLTANQITTMSKNPVGFVRVTNILPFSSGDGVESDAAFRVSAASQSNKAISCTRPAMIAAMLTVPNVQKVKFRKIVDGGTDTVKLTPILMGGDVKDIAYKLYEIQPITNYFLGQVNYPVTTEDGDIEIIRFDRGEIRDCNVKVSYQTKNGLILSSTEVNKAISNLLDLSKQFQIGSKIFNAALKSAVFDSTDYGRFTQLSVYLKRVSEPETSFSENDFQPTFTELPDLKQENVTFVQVI